MIEGDEHSSPSSTPRTAKSMLAVRGKENVNNCTEGDEHSSLPQQNKKPETKVTPPERSTTWSNINEVIESDFLISPGDIYPNRKVLLQDADIRRETKEKFEQLCNNQEGAFSKNNKDIGRTQVIEMEIDVGDSLPIAESVYTPSEAL